ncbi:ImmA/IrrE family metallo-endopeptidase [Polaribacter sp. MSW13]|uniref:ImmA/IrrE family metallo-endopeptidase n=1 Tax=Polaribacter marinus TaxID=2916838 RepID=A0A9X1VLN4_9FLAO|nr:ImmA/IrrE family metallo-endopeptidase [Polaribacter marinus]MCI2228288.1 ImmA/IrrE family metallo-endopeptidase [Polaribacter marinus]
MPLPKSKKKKYSYGFKKWSDDKSISIRQEMSLYASQPLCAFKLCDYLKIPILTPKDIPNIPESILTELLETGQRNWSAASIPINDNDSIIVHNPTHSDARQQSNIMHELAHIICGHKVDKGILANGLSGFLRNYDEVQENEAEWFGACLQLPRPALLYSLKNNLSEDDIALKYNASIEMVRYRINITAVKKQLHYSKKK